MTTSGVGELIDSLIGWLTLAVGEVWDDRRASGAP
jgi:hypothetical protein